MAGGLRGRRPKPTSTKRRQGNAGKRKPKEDEPEYKALRGWDSPPKWLDKIARDEWIRLAPSLIVARTLTEVDKGAFESLCVAYSRWRKAEKELNKKLIVKTPKGYEQQSPWVSIAKQYGERYAVLCGHFGLTPATRSRVSQVGQVPPGIPGPGKDGKEEKGDFFGGSKVWEGGEQGEASA